MSCILYIDESGVLDNKERYFVVSALLTRDKKTRQHIKRRVRKAVSLFSDSAQLHKELHGCEMTSGQKMSFLKKLFDANYGGELYVLVVDKHHISPQLFKQQSLCFNYVVSYLIKSVLKNCEHDLDIYFDTRNVKISATHELAGYIKTKAAAEFNYQHKINVRYVCSHDFAGIQVADIVSNTVWGQYNYRSNPCYMMVKKSLKRHITFPYKNFGKSG